MVNQHIVNNFLKTSKKLAAEYDDLTNISPSTNEAVLKKQVDIDYRKRHNGKSWREQAIDKLLESELLRQLEGGNVNEIAGYLSDTIENTVSHVKSLEKAASRFKNNPNVDSDRLFREAHTAKMGFDEDVVGALHDASIVNLVAKEPIRPEIGEKTTTYNLKYHEHETREPSQLKHEPEDLVDGFRFIQGYNEFASMKDIVTDQALHQNHLPPMFARYLAEKGEATGTSFMVMSKDKVEDFLLADAKDAKLEVSKNVDVVKEQNVKKRDDFDKESENQKEKHTLATVALELATAKPETRISRYKESSSELKTVCEDMSKQKNMPDELEVRHVQDYVHTRADKLGVLKNITSLEKSVRLEKQQKLNKLKGSKRQAMGSKAVDGGRKIGESRPGSSKFRH